MSLLDGGRKKDLPTMSWESVTEEEEEAARMAAPPPAPDVEHAPASSASPDPVIGEIKLEIPSLDLSTDTPPAPTGAVLGDSSTQPIVAPAPLPLPPNDQGSLTGVSFSIPGLDEPTSAAPSSGEQPPTAEPVVTPPPAPTPLAPDVTVPPVVAPPAPDVTVPPAPTPSAPDVTVPPVVVTVPLAPTPSAPDVTVPRVVVPSAPDVTAPAVAAPPAPPAPDVAPTAEPPVPDAPAGPIPPEVAAAPSALDAVLDAVESTPARPLAPPPTQTPAATPEASEAPSPQVAPPPAAAPAVPTFSPRPPGPPQATPFAAAQDLTTLHTTSTGRRSGGGRRLLSFVFVLAVIGGLVAAALVYGRPYLFPDEWDTAVKPYAQAVEEAIGVEYVEPVTVTSEAAVSYNTRRSTQLLGDWVTELPAWRALALANGRVEQANIDLLLEGWSPALYSHDDGQVYHDSALAGDQLDAQITLAMSRAALDQNVSWSAGQARRTLDAAALTEAHALEQSSAAQASTVYDAEIVQPDITPLVYLPPVLGYRVTAPTFFAELLPAHDVASGTENPLARAAGAGPLVAVAPTTSAAPVLADGEVAVRGPFAQDRSFWYMTFASYVDAPQAYAASQSVVENSLTVTDQAGRTCVASTFSGGDVNQTATVGSALEAWALAAPAELGATTSVMPDGTLQLNSCDPGVGFENGARFGVARELIGFRLGEVATVLLAAESAPPGDLDVALSDYEQSGVGAGLAALPFDTGAAVAADAARSAAATAAASTLPALAPVEPAE